LVENSFRRKVFAYVFIWIVANFENSYFIYVSQGSVATQ